MQHHDLRLRRLRLLSDVLEDYQDNMNRVFRLIEMDVGLDADNVGARHAYREREPRRHSETTAANTRFFNRTVGGLTTAQILQFTTPVAYDATMNETRCPITWETFTPGQELLRVNACNHIFSREAIIEWFGRNRHCPVCRSNPFSSSYSSTTPSSQSQMPYNVLGYSAVVSLESFDPSLNVPTEDSSGSTPSEQSASQRSSSSFVNALLRGLVNNINESVNSNTDYYEREFTFNVNDLLSLSADALANEASRALSSYSSSSIRPPNRDDDVE